MSAFLCQLRYCVVSWYTCIYTWYICVVTWYKRTKTRHNTLRVASAYEGVSVSTLLLCALATVAKR